MPKIIFSDNDSSPRFKIKREPCRVIETESGYYVVGRNPIELFNRLLHDPYYQDLGQVPHTLPPLSTRPLRFRIGKLLRERATHAEIAASLYYVFLTDPEARKDNQLSPIFLRVLRDEDTWEVHLCVLLESVLRWKNAARFIRAAASEGFQHASSLPPPRLLRWKSTPSHTDLEKELDIVCAQGVHLSAVAAHLRSIEKEAFLTLAPLLLAPPPANAPLLLAPSSLVALSLLSLWRRDLVAAYTPHLCPKLLHLATLLLMPDGVYQ